MEQGIRYREQPLLAGDILDLEGIQKTLEEDTSIRVAAIQRSSGYSFRRPISLDDMKKAIERIHAIRPDVMVFVDNCYGEFTAIQEPTDFGADVMAGSLIKNAGGGIAENGGYICGRKELVERCSYRMTTPGLGREIGASLGHNRTLYMGLFHAPHVVGEALKTAVFAAALFEKLGFAVSPTSDETRADIIQTLFLKEPETLIDFCQGLQSGSPVDAFVVPEPWDMPGYDNQVIMAAGTFTMGASIELSADAPLREPYAVFLQGGLNYDTGKIGVMSAAQRLFDHHRI